MYVCMYVCMYVSMYVLKEENDFSGKEQEKIPERVTKLTSSGKIKISLITINFEIVLYENGTTELCANKTIRVKIFETTSLSAKKMIYAKLNY